MKNRNRASLVLALSFFLSSCAGGLSLSKTTELPEDKIALLAGQIEDAVAYTEIETPTISDITIDEETGEIVDDFEPLSMIISMEEIRQDVPALSELNVDDEIMITAIRGRIFRWSAIKEFRQKGCVGETRDGFVQNMKSDECSGDPIERNRIAHIVMQENRNRRVMYEHIVKTNGWSTSTMGRVRRIFSEKIYEKAWAGTPLQTPEGEWERK